LPLDPDQGTEFPMRIRIHKVIESGYNPDPNSDPDPQPWLKHNRLFKLEQKQTNYFYGFFSLTDELTTDLAPQMYLLGGRSSQLERRW
jgi:hypothetical protein